MTDKHPWRKDLMDMHQVSYAEAQEHGGMPCRNCNGTGFVPYMTGTVTRCIECESGIIFHDDEHELQWIERKLVEVKRSIRRLEESKEQLTNYRKLIEKGDK